MTTPRYVVSNNHDASTALRRLARAGWQTREGFALPDPAWATHQIIFGHWAALGLSLCPRHLGLHAGQHQPPQEGAARPGGGGEPRETRRGPLQKHAARDQEQPSGRAW